jgi:hypothetical protein
MLRSKADICGAQAPCTGSPVAATCVLARSPSVRRTGPWIALLCSTTLFAFAAHATLLPGEGIGMYANITNYAGPLGIVNSGAMYTTQALGGGLYGTNVGLNTFLGSPDAALATTPVSMLPGLTSGTLDVHASGSRALASISLGTGISRVLANSADDTAAQNSIYYTSVNAQDQAVDGLTWHLANPSATAFVTINLHVDGNLLFASTNGSYSQDILLALGGGSFSWGAREAARDPAGAVFGGVTNSHWDSFSLTNQTATGFDFSGVYAVTDGQYTPVSFSQALDNCGFGALCDFTNTARLSFTLPAGVRFTSDSGVFLTEASAPPSTVPEPATLILIGLGMAGLGGSRRRHGR